MADVLSNGTGEFDRQHFLEDLPKQLGIKERRVKSAIEGLARDRKRTTLVQGVSYLRQKKLEDAAKSLNNLLACHRVGSFTVVSLECLLLLKRMRGPVIVGA